MERRVGRRIHGARRRQHHGRGAGGQAHAEGALPPGERGARVGPARPRGCRRGRAQRPAVAHAELEALGAAVLGVPAQRVAAREAVAAERALVIARFEVHLFTSD